MDILYRDKRIVVCLKPSGVLSTDESGGMPELLRAALNEPNGCVRTVHRLDRVVGGVMVFARSVRAASELSAQMRNGAFQKSYLAVVHGTPKQPCGIFTDLLLRDTARRMTMVVSQPQKGAQEAVLEYETLAVQNGLSLVRIRLRTGRTHQIRVQFSARGLPLVGDKKYGLGDDACPIALWSHQLSFRHPESDEPLSFSAPPPMVFPWTAFDAPLLR